MTPETCTTCKGEGWLMDREGEPCPDCLNPEILGGTGLKGGVLTDQLRRQVEAVGEKAE